MSSTESESVSYAEYENLSQKIIMEVQKRPALYDTTLRNDRKTKNTLWEEVYQGVFNNWETLSDAEKARKGNTIQKRWKNLRDSFAKELAMQRRKSGQGVIKKRKYIHFDSMMFLVPSLRQKETSTNTESTSQGNNSIELAENQRKYKKHRKDLAQTKSNQASSYQRPSKSQKNEKVDEQNLPNFFKGTVNTCDEYVYDEDINFSQMIVPMLRKLDDDQKHYAKVEIMNVLQKAKSL
ncbi:hypothetical protein HW555_006860 [Spodoptera exigua]|uniref:MADF domain-containing protein n=1 Tax=Spodoptera exigua TaxID=7107 RepID=A0A835GH68_SPOEX|nr:hypothetical protein HW555_006860 [Spodoptera exigua]